jgi:hypothetical protein
MNFQDVFEEVSHHHELPRFMRVLLCGSAATLVAVNKAQIRRQTKLTPLDNSMWFNNVLSRSLTPLGLAIPFISSDFVSATSILDRTAFIFTLFVLTLLNPLNVTVF